MGFMWLDSSSDPRQAEYARAYERAIKGGSIDSAISWELSGYKTKDGSLVTMVPAGVKESLRKTPRYSILIERVDVAVRALRESRHHLAGAMLHAQATQMRPA
jgi:hypothetical protein